MQHDLRAHAPVLPIGRFLSKDGGSLPAASLAVTPTTLGSAIDLPTPDDYVHVVERQLQVRSPSEVWRRPGHVA